MMFTNLKVKAIGLGSCIFFLWWSSVSPAALSGDSSRHFMPDVPVPGQETKLPESGHLVDPAQRNPFDNGPPKQRILTNTAPSITTAAEHDGYEGMPVVPVHSHEEQSNSSGTQQPHQGRAVVAPPVVDATITTSYTDTHTLTHLEHPRPTHILPSSPSLLNSPTPEMTPNPDPVMISSIPTLSLSRSVPEVTHSVIVSTPTTSTHFSSTTPVTPVFESQSIMPTSVHFSTILSSMRISTTPWEGSSTRLDLGDVNDDIKTETTHNFPEISHTEKEGDGDIADVLSTGQIYLTNKSHQTPPLSLPTTLQSPVYKDSWTKPLGAATDTSAPATEEEEEGPKPSKPEEDHSLKPSRTDSADEKKTSSNLAATTSSSIMLETTTSTEDVSTQPFDRGNRRIYIVNEDERMTSRLPPKYRIAVDKTGSFEAKTGFSTDPPLYSSGAVLRTTSPARITKSWMAFTNQEDEMPTSLDDNQSESLFSHLSPLTTRSTSVPGDAEDSNSRSTEEEDLQLPGGFVEPSDEIPSSGEGEMPPFQKLFNPRTSPPCRHDGVCITGTSTVTTAKPEFRTLTEMSGTSDYDIFNRDQTLTAVAIYEKATTAVPTVTIEMTNLTEVAATRRTTTLAEQENTITASITERSTVDDVTSSHTLMTNITRVETVYTSETAPKTTTPEMFTEAYVKPVSPADEDGAFSTQTRGMPDVSITTHHDVIKPSTVPTPDVSITTSHDVIKPSAEPPPDVSITTTPHDVIKPSAEPPPDVSNTTSHDVIKPSAEPPLPPPPPSSTLPAPSKPQTITKRPPKTAPPNPSPRTWRPRPDVITPPPSPQLPPIYMTATFNMSWGDFCLQRDYFKRQILGLLFKLEESELFQVVLVDISRHCPAGGSTSHRYRRHTSSARDGSRDEHAHGRFRRATATSYVVKVDFYIADLYGKYDKAMTMRLAKVLEMSMDGVHPALRLFLKFLSFKIHGHQSVLGSHEPPGSSTFSNGVLAGIVLGALISLTLVITAVIFLVIRQYKYGGVKQMRFASAPGKRASYDPSCDAMQLTPVSHQLSHALAYTNPTCQLADERDAASTLLSLPGLGAMMDNLDDAEEEFLSLPNPHPKLSDLPHGAEDRNRYAHVIPIPETRVHLQTTRGSEQSDYINANFVRGYQGAPRRFIATQGPLEHTRGDFWRMVWQEQVQCIIMVTGLEEQGLSKCAEYWPNTYYGDTLRVYGDFGVLLQNREEQYDCIISQLRLKHMERNLIRELHHVWLTRWPDRGVPEAGAMVTRALQDVQYLIDSNLGPTVIHCSPGTGRTGTVLAIALCMRQYEDTGRVDVFKTVSQMRHDRAGAVKTKEQYAFIYQAIYEHALSLSNPSMDSVDSAVECDGMSNA